MTRTELVEHLARLHFEQLQVATRISNWRTQFVPSVAWHALDECDRVTRRKAMASVLDECDRMELLTP